MNVITKKVSLPDGREISIETGRLAKQADGAVLLTMGKTMLLATVCAAKDAVPGTDFMPLQVEYREKYAAAGRFPGGFTRREGKASDEEILTCRLVDRALRPLFPSNYHAEVYVNVNLYSADGVDMPDALAGFAASAALAASDIPFEGPISEVRVARINGEFVINPTFQQLEQADMDLMVGATEENIMMVEGEMKEVSEQDLLEALKAAHEAIKPQCRLQKELMKELGTDVKREYCHEVNDEELREDLAKVCYQKAYDVTKQALEKHERADAFEAIREEYKEAYAAAHPDMTEDELAEKNALIDRYYHDVERDAMRRCVLDEGIRLDGRKTTDIRPIWCEVGTFPGPHGSAIFTRGETQSLSTCTLGTKLDEKLIDGALVREYQKFLLHYNFPPFSTGEAKAQRGVGRREIGHGHLAWRGIKGQLPDDYPYTIRVVSDILGDEDHLGDMDFKTTGTKNGLTATQMDIKCDGLSYEILEKALMQAKAGREHIMGEMMKTISEPRPELKPHVPRIEQIIIPKEFIGAVIGPGGKIIQQMQEDTKTTITIDEEDGVGKVQVSAPDKACIEAALAKIKAIVAIPEVGEVYQGKVQSVMPYGCFVEFMPGKDGLLHISEIDWKRLETVEEAGIHEGDEIDVKLIDIDQKTGKFKLSHRVLIEKPADYVERPQRERRPRPERGERGDRGDRRSRGGYDRGDRGGYDRGDRGERPQRQSFHHNDENPSNEEAPQNGEFRSALDDLLK